MTCSLEKEVRLYWDAMNELRQLQRAGFDRPEIDRAIDELEVLSMYTEWPALRRLCALEVASYAEAGSVAVS